MKQRDQLALYAIVEFRFERLLSSETEFFLKTNRHIYIILFFNCFGCLQAKHNSVKNKKKKK